jgi:hypothetical protein
MQQGKVFFPKTRLVSEILVPELLAFRADADNKADNLVDALTNGLMMLNDLIPARSDKKTEEDLGVVPGSYEDMFARAPVLPGSSREAPSKSMFAWRQKDKKKSRFW